jgi:hypothetical protein
MGKTKHASRHAPRTPRPVNRRLVDLFALAGAAALAFLLVPRASSRDAGGTGQAASAPADPVADTRALIGRWVRTDHPYVIEIRAAAPDGALDVQYLNPRPIHVSYASAERHDSRLGVTIELNDQGYAGSLYTLTYEPAADRLVGTYRLPTRNEEYVVSFSRRAGD